MNTDKPIRRVNRFQQEGGFFTAEGVKRIARARDVSQEKHNAHQSAHQTGKAKRSLTVENPDGYILACLHSKDGDLNTLDRELLYVGRALAGLQGDTALVAAVFGTLDEAVDLSAMGADEVIIFEDPALQQYLPEAKVACLQQLAAQYQPRHMLLPESDFGDADLGRRYAVASGKTVATSVFEISETGLRRACGNGRQQASAALTEVILLESGTTGATELEFITAAERKAAGHNACREQREEHNFSMAAEDIPLVEADFVLSAGNGVKNMETFHKLAKALDASVGGSRVVVDDGKLPRERQVGATGKIVTASVYIAIGISGAVQHLQGIKDCRYVIAVNSDDSCDMIKRADLSIIADAEAWMQSMLKALDNNPSEANP